MFAANDTEMEGWIQSYEKDLKAYQLVTKVEEHIDVDLCTADHPAKCNPNYFCPVEWKTEFIDHSLHYLAEVWKLFSGRYLMPDSPPTALLDRVCKGCFVVTWLVPSHMIPSLIEKIKVDTDFFQQYHILRVTVGSDCVYEEVTEESLSVSSFYASSLRGRLQFLWLLINSRQTISVADCPHYMVKTN